MSRLERCVGDFETRSEEDLKKGGAWKYAQGSTTEVTAFAYNLPRSNQPKLWMPRRIAMGTHDILLSEFDDWSEEYDLTFDDPTDLFEYIANGGIFEAHNAMFERAIWRSICVPRLRWPDIPNSQWRCSAAKAASFSLPRSLEKACLVQRLPVEKDMDGHKLMMKLCKPRRVTKNNSDKWAGTKEDYIRQGLYCVNDVIAQDRFSRSLPDLSATEQEVWEIDQEINEYGLPVDVAFVDKALANLEVLKAQYTAEIERLTNGEVQRHTQRARVKTWLASQGLDLPNTQAATMDAIIAEASLPADLLRVITVVRMAGRASTSKYNAIRSRLTSEGRVRDILIYAGAGRTSRWSGTGFQPQNITRGTIKDMEAAIANIMDSELEELQEEYDDLFQLFSSALRGAIIPVKGKKMAVADYNAIEGRGLFWVAEHEKGLPIFYDGKDPYLYMASSIFGIPYEVMADARAKVKSENKAKNENKPLPYGDERQAGKVAVLGCFSADTIVVTNHGNKRIIDVKLEDKVWDGIKWVSHKGLVPKGIQKTMRLSGVTLTPDHLIWTPKGFMRADQVQSQGLNFLRSATSLANLPSNAYPTGLEAGLKILNTDVPAVSLLTPILTTLKAVKLKGAIYVPKSSLSLPEKIRGRLRPLCLIEKKGLSGRTYTMQCGQELQTHLMPTIYRMEAEASLYAQSGRRLNLSYDGYPPTLQDTKQGLKLTGLITTKGTPQITVSLSPEQKTCIIPGVVGILSTKGEPIAPPSLTLKSPLNCHTPTPIALSAKGEAPSLLLGEQKHAVFDLAHCGDLNRFTILTEDGPLLVHNCGYGMGPDKLQMYAAGMGVELTLEMCQLIVDTYRSVNRPVCELWWACEQAAINAVRYPGQVFRVNSKIAYKKVNKFLFCQLPSGRMIPYPFPRLRKETVWYPSKGGKPPRSQTKDVLYYEETNSYTRKWELVSTYGAKLCLAADTEVLTDSGWKAIVSVTLDDKVWDGMEWVNHEGLVFQGVKTTICLDGVRMTPDHKVLTEEGWKIASSCTGHNRIAGRTDHSDSLSQLRWKKILVDREMRLQNREGHSGYEYEERPVPELRMPEREIDRPKTNNSWHEQASSFSSFQVDDGQVSATDAPSVPKLWSARNSSMRTLDKLRKFLGGHATLLCSRFGFGQDRQRRGVFERELPLDNPHGKLSKQEKKYICRNRRSEGIFEECESEIPSKLHDANIQIGKKFNSVKPGRVEEVYDLLNCGPRTRFTVRFPVGGEGIVHNCENLVQALCRDIMAEAMRVVRKDGRFQILLTVHDELVTQTDLEGQSHKILEGLMMQMPKWADGFPLAVEGQTLNRYQK